MTHTAQVRASLATIPAHKWRAKIGRFVFAVLLGALLYLVALPQHWPPSIILGIAAAIGYCLSQDLMVAIVRFLVATIRDVGGAVRNAVGKNGTPPTSPPAPPRVTP